MLKQTERNNLLIFDSVVAIGMIETNINGEVLFSILVFFIIYEFLQIKLVNWPKKKIINSNKIHVPL